MNENHGYFHDRTNCDSNESEEYTMTTTMQPCKGRWGFHPCGYPLYLKLKRLHKWYWLKG